MASRTAVLWRVARDRQLRRLEVSFIGFAFAEHASWLAIIVYAYDRGGVAESGLLAMIQLTPATLVAPLAAYAGDRFRPERVLAFGFAAQSTSMLATAVAMWAGRPLLVYSAATVAATCMTFSRPVVGAVLPSITQTPADLVAGNVVIGFVEHVGMLLGPLIGGLILAIRSPAAVYAVCAAATSSSTFVAVRLRLVRGNVVGEVVVSARDVFGAVVDGFRALRSHAALRALIVLTAIGGIVGGVTDVLMVLFAEARLGRGGGAAGLLGVGLGGGAIVGAVLAAGLIGRTRLTPYLVMSATLFGCAFLALSGVDVLVLGIAVFVLFGVAQSMLRVTASVGVQRLSPRGFLTRIFGVSEGIQMGAMGLGSFIVSLVVRGLGLGPALVSLGGAVLLTMAWVSTHFRRLGGDIPPPPADVIDRLLADPVLEHLPVPALSRMAQSLERLVLPRGHLVITQGDPGDRYFLVVEGLVDVTIDGRMVRTMGPGQSFGEIALLRDVPRTATVRCVEDSVLFALNRDEFLQAVTGHPSSLAVASRVVSAFVNKDSS